jgi:capsular polysaccharide biosynthesis protein/Mrp family chromosome partitioning ATPase
MNDTSISRAPTMALYTYLKVLRRQWWLIALVTALALGAAGLYVKTATPKYAASMKIVVGQGRSLFTADASGAFQPFTQTMTDLLQSQVVARQTIQKRNLKLSPESLLGNLSVTSNPDTSVLQVTYEDTNARRAAAVLSTIGSVFSLLVDTELARRPVATSPGAPAVAQSQPISATVFDPAHAVSGQVSPHVKRTLIIALVLGLFGGVLLAFLRDGLSGRIRTEEEATEAFGAQVIAQLPPGVIGTKPSQVPYLPGKLSTRVTESIKLLAATLRFSNGQRESGVIVVTSARPEDGKSTIVAQLSTVLARSGRSVVAVEADVHRPALHRLLDVESPALGLTDVLDGDVQLTDALVAVPTAEGAAALVPARGRGGRRPVVEPRDPADVRGDLQLLPSGHRSADASELFSLGASGELVAQLRALSDYVLIDTPPVLMSGDSFPLMQVADLVLVVCRQSHTSRDEARAVQARLKSLGVKSFSVVFTESSDAQRLNYGYSYAD